MILSIDVAIKNLSFCLLNGKNIIKWELIDLIKEDNDLTVLCSGQTGKKAPCKKQAQYMFDKAPLCKVHAKKIDFSKLIEINKTKCNHESKCKNDIYYINNNKGFCKKHCSLKQQRYYTVKNITDNELRVLLFTKLDSYTFNYSEILTVLIEKQPKHASEQMRSLAYAIYDYFIIKSNYKCNVEWMDPKNKLTVYDGPVITCDLTNQYKRNKWFACKYCEWHLNKMDDTNNLKYFQSNKKQDDLADCFLQGIYYLNGGSQKKELTEQQTQVYKEQNIIKYKKIKARKPKAGKTHLSLSELKYNITKNIKTDIANIEYFFGKNFDLTLLKGGDMRN